jgi:hypothetical protein
MTKTLPTRPLSDPKFRYVPAALTNIRRTFRKARLLNIIKAKQ